MMWFSGLETSEMQGLSDLPQGIWVLLAKVLGAVLGSAISICYVLPSDKREAFIRFFVGASAGLIFGSATGLALADYLEISDRLTAVEISLSGSAAASLSAWWALGALQRFASRLSR